MLKKNRLLNSLLIFFVILNSFSQRETEHWYFGNRAAIKFIDNQRPRALSNSNMNTPYGSATISDKNGNLLFYTSGATVFNANHSTMENGALLASDNEVLQTSIIIPKPGSPNIYYLITLKDKNDPPPIGDFIEPGLYFSVIDINKNGGLGEVTKKNLTITDLVSEKLTAVHAKDGKSIWLIAFGKKSTTSAAFDTFYSFKIDESGINTTPVASTISATIFNNQGALKASPNGSFLLLSNYTNAILTDFDDETGKVSSYDYLKISQTIGAPPKAHGVEFSKDSKYAYVETINAGENIILQYNTAKIDDIQEVHISNRGESYMQLAKDGNIYVTSEGYLSKVTPPKSSDETVASFFENTIDLNGKKSILGMPNFIQSYFRTRILSENGCLDTKTSFEIDTYATITAAEWDFGDGTPISKEIKSEHTYTSAGNYTVSCTITVNSREIKLYKNIKIYTPSAYAIGFNEIIQCDIDNDGTDFFNLTVVEDEITPFKLINGITYHKSFTDAQNNNEISTPENYENTGRNEIFIKIYNMNGCATIKSFFVESVFVKLEEIEDFYACSISNENDIENLGNFNLNLKKPDIRTKNFLNTTDKIRFYPDALSAQLTTGELNGELISKSTVIWVRVDTSIGCGGIEPFNLKVNQLPKTNNISKIYTICYKPSLKPPVIISADASNERFEWKDNLGNIQSTDQNFILNTLGEYSLTVFKTENNIECSNTKIFSVINPSPPIFSNILVDTEDETNNIVAVMVSGNSSYEFSLNNINFFSNGSSYTFTQVTPGLRTIYVRDINSCENPIQKTASVLGVKSFFTPNDDDKNDFWNIRGLDAEFYKAIQIKIYNRFGTIIASIDDFDSEGWDGTFNGKLQISNTYWYKAEIIDINDNIIKKIGYFSLIRK